MHADIGISDNAPVSISNQSASSEAVKAQHVNAYGRDVVVQAEFTDAVRSLMIVDFSLFES